MWLDSALATSLALGSTLNAQDVAVATKEKASPAASSSRGEQRGFAQSCAPYMVLTRVATDSGRVTG
jgi:hypothetical protein